MKPPFGPFTPPSDPTPDGIGKGDAWEGEPKSGGPKTESPSANGKAHAAKPSARLKLQRLDAVKPVPVHWLVPGFMPAGKLVLLAGDGGNGKSMITLSVAADHSRGRPALGQQYAAPTHESLLFTCEDDASDTLVPRLLALGADLAKIHRMQSAIGADGKPIPFSLADVDLIDAALTENQAIRLVVIDPVGAYMGRTGRDDNKDSELRTVLDPLAELAAKHNVTMNLVKHLNKGASPRAVHRVSGSTGYVNAARMAYLVAPAVDDTGADGDRRVMLPIKSNLTKDRNGLAFRLVALPADDARDLVKEYGGHLNDDDRQRLADQLFRIEWLGLADDNPDAVLADANRSKRTRPKIKACANWLREYLGERAWPSKEIEDAADKAGFTRDDVFRAKADLKADGLRNRKRGMGEWWTGFGNPADWIDRPTPPA